MPSGPERDTHVSFYSPGVLAQYRESPDKYRYRSDYFEGSVTLTDAYYRQLSEADKDREWIDVKFGYRTLRNGEFCIAVFKYHLARKSPGHVSRWHPHCIEDRDWLDYERDERFSLWYKRYREGDWNVENGPAERLAEELKLINALTLDAIDCRIYDVSEEVEFTFPAAENSWKYEEAHVQLYRILIDGLSLSCISSLARRLGCPLEKGAKKKLRALKTALPQLKTNPPFEAPLNNVSELRGLASHRERQPAVPERAFEVFTGDLNDCLDAIRLLKTTLEGELGYVNGYTWIDDAGNFHTDAVHMVERLTLIDPDTIHYEITLEDPKAYTRPWTMSWPMLRETDPGFQLLEEACWEGERDLPKFRELGFRYYFGDTWRSR